MSQISFIIKMYLIGLHVAQLVLDEILIIQ